MSLFCAKICVNGSKILQQQKYHRLGLVITKANKQLALDNNSRSPNISIENILFTMCSYLFRMPDCGIGQGSLDNSVFIPFKMKKKIL